MNSAAWTLLAALGGAALTGLSSLGVVWYQEARRSRSAEADGLHAAVVELLSRSMAVALRAQTIGETAKIRSGVPEGLDIALRIRKPVEIMELHDWMAQDMSPLNHAWSEIWARGDQELVRLANRVLYQCADVLAVGAARQPSKGALERTRRWLIGDRWTPEMQDELKSAQAGLADARKALADYARTRLGRDGIDLFV